jgi:hypothetical protein
MHVSGRRRDGLCDNRDGTDAGENEADEDCRIMNRDEALSYIVPSFEPLEDA